MQEISIFVILKATSTYRQTRRLHIFKTFCIYLASDNTLIILVYSDQMTSEARINPQIVRLGCLWLLLRYYISGKTIVTDVLLLNKQEMDNIENIEAQSNCNLK